jgi:hypothetical protein
MVPMTFICIFRTACLLPSRNSNCRFVTGSVNGPPYGAITDTRVPVSLLNPNAASENLDWIDIDLTVVDPGDEKIDLVVLAARNLFFLARRRAHLLEQATLSSEAIAAFSAFPMVVDGVLA